MRVLYVLIILFVISGCTAGVGNNIYTEGTSVEIEEVVETETVKEVKEVVQSKDIKEFLSVDNYASEMVLDDLEVEYIDEVIYFYRGDFNNDDIVEWVVATGVDGKSEFDTYVSGIYLGKYIDDKYILTDELFDSRGYTYNKVEIINMQNTEERFLYCGITNSASMFGFELYKFGSDGIELLKYSASATGSGVDELIDIDEDGTIDGYRQFRKSYDVFYYLTVRSYIWNGDSFELFEVDVDVSEYPKTVKEVVLQYLTLEYINISEEMQIISVTNRLAELSLNEFHEIAIGREILRDTFLGFESGLKFDVEETDNNANVIVSYKNDEKQTNLATFILVKRNNKWLIEVIE